MKKEFKIICLVGGVILMALGASNYFNSLFIAALLVIIGAIGLSKGIE